MLYDNVKFYVSLEASIGRLSKLLDNNNIDVKLSLYGIIIANIAHAQKASYFLSGHLFSKREQWFGDQSTFSGVFYVLYSHIYVSDLFELMTLNVSDPF